MTNGLRSSSPPARFSVRDCLGASPTPAGGRAPGPSLRCVRPAVETPSSPNPSSSECGVAIALPTGKPDASVRMKLLTLGALPVGRPGDRPAVQAGLERGAGAVGERDVVDEDADALRRPVAGVGDGDLDALAGVRREVDAPLLPTRRVAARGVPGAGGAGRGARVDAVPRLVVRELRVQRRPSPRGSSGRSPSSCSRWRPAASSSRHRRECAPPRTGGPTLLRCRTTSRSVIDPPAAGTAISRVSLL